MRIIVHWVVNVFSSHSIHIQIYSLQASCQLYKKYFYFISFLLHVITFFLSGQVWLFLYGILSLQYSGKGKLE